MCGIVGIAGIEPVNVRLYDTLTVLQHRGKTQRGIATTRGEGSHKDNGLAKDVFRTRHARLIGHMGIGHVRYPTASTSSRHERSPRELPYGIALAHNGNLTNAETLKQELFDLDRRHINTRSDSEILLNVFAHEIDKQRPERLTHEHVFRAIEGVHRRCKGAYAAVAMIPGLGMIAFRDPHGIRPLSFGYRDTAEGREWMVASESVALDALGFTEGDVLPGEALVVDLRDETCTAEPVRPAPPLACLSSSTSHVQTRSWTGSLCTKADFGWGITSRARS